VSAVHILAAYRVTFSALLLLASLEALSAGHAHSHRVLILVAAEIAGALLLCWRRTQWLGAGLLFVVFTCAQLLSALEGSWPIHFLQYAASTLLIVSLDRALAQRADPRCAGPRAEPAQ
jgi:hypothetical protein